MTKEEYFAHLAIIEKKCLDLQKNLYRDYVEQFRRFNKGDIVKIGKYNVVVDEFYISKYTNIPEGNYRCLVLTKDMKIRKDRKTITFNYDNSGAQKVGVYEEKT